MGYSVVPTVATGDLWTAANHNTYIKDNFAAGVPALFSAAGDLVYGSSPGIATRLAIGTEGKLLTVLSNGLPGWGGPLITHKGGSATDWLVDGTTIYTPHNLMVQMGIVPIVSSIVAGGSRLAQPAFSPAFAGKPLVFFSVKPSAAAYSTVGTLQSVSASSAIIMVKNNDTVETYASVLWLAIGSAA